MITVRPATLDDVQQVLPMVEKISNLHRKWDADRFTIKPDVGTLYAQWLPQRVDDSQSVFLVAQREDGVTGTGAIVGYLIATVEEELPIYWLPECGYIHDIWVEPEYRHEGAARQMVLLAVERFTQLGVKQVRLETAAVNDTGRALFAACGFRPATIEMMCVIEKVGP